MFSQCCQQLKLVNRFCPFQSDSPGAHLNALGLYLLVSLFFVLGTKVEFALVLLVYRKMSFRRLHTKTIRNKHISMSNSQDLKRTSNKDPKIMVHKSRNNLERTQSIQSSINPIIAEQLKPSLSTEDTTNRIDFAALCLFLSSYLIFNCVYFITYI